MTKLKSNTSVEQQRIIRFVRGCFIFYLKTDSKEPALIVKHIKGDQYEIYLPSQRSTTITTLNIKNTSCAFEVGNYVKETPLFSQLVNRGLGIITQIKNVADQTLANVHFFEVDEQIWLPYERLSLKHNNERDLIQKRFPKDHNQAELFRLKSLAQAIMMWNLNTGSLSSMDIDPLPHQINLVHHILESGNLNWLIADDVGLGKTVETGMLITALNYRNQAKRVLLVTPAGLVQQWKDELYYKFKLENFLIFNQDFKVNEPRQWRMFDHVIASIDSLKTDDNLESLKSSGHWDLIIFDEAHRLTRQQLGNRVTYSDRYRLAAVLREQTDSLLFLTATPHQGKSDRFQSLLMLLRPELKADIEMLTLNPEIVSEMIFRNNKETVTDLEGNYLFHGKSSHSIDIPTSIEMQTFDKALQEYLKLSYQRSIEIGGYKGRAIGLVMAIYRKLAASSIAAILNALEKRLSRLTTPLQEETIIQEYNFDSEFSFYGEYEEKNIDIETKDKFVEDEDIRLADLIKKGKAVESNDNKLKVFLTEILQTILKNNKNEKIVVFTEYLNTQTYLQNALTSNYGDEKIAIINGSMDYQERMENIQIFNTSGQFLISTEAGGEGINLHHNCHILINYDLPWNPMRLVQRIGRVYRYGQTKKVQVYNLLSQDTADEKIIKLLHNRIDKVVLDLGGLSDEYNENLKDEIIGVISEIADIETIIINSLNESTSDTQNQIDEALVNAAEISEKQKELFSYAVSYDPNEKDREFIITLDHVKSFLKGMFSLLNIQIEKTLFQGDVWRIRLPEEISEAIGVRRSILEITTNKMLGVNRSNTEVIDINHPLLQFLLNEATSENFGGKTALLQSGYDLTGNAVVTAVLKWQNQRGINIHTEFYAFLLNNSKVEVNPSSFFNWLLNPIDNNTSIQTSLDETDNIDLVFEEIDKILENKSSNNHIPHNSYIYSGAWIN